VALLAGLLYPATAASAKPLSPSVSAAAARSAIVLGAPGGTIPVPPDAYRATEGQLGRHLAAIRMYARWDTPFPDATSIWARDNGRRVLLSVKAGTRAGRPVLYRDIAAATPGTAIYGDISRWAQSLHTFSAPIFFTFNHEPEGAGSVQSGTAAEYVAAWRRIVAVFEKSGVTNVSYMFIGTGNGFNPKIARPVLPYYPGDDVVDAIGADAYNWYTCRVTPSNPWRSLADLLEPLRQFGLAHPTKDLWVAEFASAEDPAVPGRKAQWVADTQALFAKPGYSSFAGVLIWYGVVPDSQCRFRIDSSPTALLAYRALAQAQYYSGTSAALASAR